MKSEKLLKFCQNIINILLYIRDEFKNNVEIKKEHNIDVLYYNNKWICYLTESEEKSLNYLLNYNLKDLSDISFELNNLSESINVLKKFNMINFNLPYYDNKEKEILERFYGDSDENGKENIC